MFSNPNFLHGSSVFGDETKFIFPARKTVVSVVNDFFEDFVTFKFKLIRALLSYLNVSVLRIKVLYITWQWFYIEYKMVLSIYCY